MLILGIESATVQVGCAIGGHEGVLASTHSARPRRHAESLTPAIEFVSRQAELLFAARVEVQQSPAGFIQALETQQAKARRHWQLRHNLGRQTAGGRHLAGGAVPPQRGVELNRQGWQRHQPEAIAPTGAFFAPFA